MATILIPIKAPAETETLDTIQPASPEVPDELVNVFLPAEVMQAFWHQQ